MPFCCVGSGPHELDLGLQRELGATGIKPFALNRPPILKLCLAFIDKTVCTLCFFMCPPPSHVHSEWHAPPIDLDISVCKGILTRCCTVLSPCRSGPSPLLLLGAIYNSKMPCSGVRTGVQTFVHVINGQLVLPLTRMAPCRGAAQRSENQLLRPI